MPETQTPVDEMIDITKLPVSKDENTVEVSVSPRDEFTDNLPTYYQNYTRALRRDRSDSARKFVWAEHNPGMNPDAMFEQAVVYAIEAEALTLEKDTKGELSSLDDSNLNGYNRKLKDQFGPDGTASGKALEEIRASVKGVIRDGLGKEGVKTLFRITDYK